MLVVTFTGRGSIQRDALNSWDPNRSLGGGGEAGIVTWRAPKLQNSKHKWWWVLTKLHEALNQSCIYIYMYRYSTECIYIVIMLKSCQHLENLLISRPCRCRSRNPSAANAVWTEGLWRIQLPICQWISMSQILSFCRLLGRQEVNCRYPSPKTLDWRFMWCI